MVDRLLQSTVDPDEQRFWDEVIVPVLYEGAVSYRPEPASTDPAIQSIGADSEQQGMDFMAEQLMESFRMGSKRNDGSKETPEQEAVRRAGKDFFLRAANAIDACAPLFSYVQEIDQSILQRLRTQVGELRTAVAPELRREGGRMVH